MKVKTITQHIEQFAPLKLQESFDNAGLIIGNYEQEVNKILVCLDVTNDVINEAIQLHCDMIVSHHPMIFLGLKKITPNNLAYKAIQNNIVIYCAHTNLDSAKRGINYTLAEKLGLKNIKPLAENHSDETCGLGAIGEFDTEISQENLLLLIKNVCKTNNLKHSKILGITIKKLALCGGSGREFISEAIANNADAYLSAELKYNDFDRYEQPLFVVDAGHYETEVHAIDILYDIISKNETQAEVVKTSVNTNFVVNS
ncbi:GTP cyclohydrolase 1 type 2 [Bacteroidia bacterium]|nr:GTP cyclohydrolase 1 type 2 [Bacteroidia bacterium]